MMMAWDGDVQEKEEVIKGRELVTFLPILALTGNRDEDM